MLPLLDRETYQYASSDWVFYAGQALQQAGYLPSDPTGTFDDDFATALQAFQTDRGIYEQDHVGPQTWAALGVADPDQTSGQDTAQAGGDASGGQADAQAAPTTAADPGLEVFTNGKRYIIFTDEVRSGGTISWRARNPGNIRNGDHYGAYPGKKANTASAGSFAVFPDEQTGFDAIKHVLKGYGNVTVAQAMHKYAPAGDGSNDPDAYARSVAQKMGVPVTTSVQSLDDGQMQTFAEAIKHVEGWTAGTAQSLDDDSLPDAVKAGIRGS
jgi:hypothetical protein